MSKTYLLAEYFGLQAGWREAKARQYPGDERNPQSARALLSLADYVQQPLDRELGDMRPAATTLLEEQVIRHGPADITLGGERTKRVVARYGYEAPALTVGQHRAFLEELPAHVLEDAYEDATANRGEDPTGLLGEHEVGAARDGIELGSLYWRRRLTESPAWCEEWVAQSRYADREGLDMLEDALDRKGGK